MAIQHLLSRHPKHVVEMDSQDCDLKVNKIQGIMMTIFTASLPSVRTFPSRRRTDFNLSESVPKP